MKKFTIIVVLMAVLSGLYAKASQSSGEIDLMCRNKAKEAATETYRGCVVENKSRQIDQIRKEYKEQLRALKEKYDSELQGVAGSKKVSTSNKTNSKKAKDLVKSKKHIDMNFTQESQPQEPVEAKSTGGGGDDSRMDLPEPIPVEEPASNN